MRGWETRERANWSQDPGEERPSLMPTSPDCQFVPVHEYHMAAEATHTNATDCRGLTSLKHPYTYTRKPTLTALLRRLIGHI